MSGVPFGSFGFKVLVGLEGGDAGKNIGCFQEVSGLSVQLNVTDLVEGGANNTTHKLIGNASYSNLVLKRGFCDVELYSWIQDFLSPSGGVKRLNLKICILGDEKSDNGEPAVVKTFHVKRAVPVKWDGPSLNVMQDGIATESLELAYEELSIG